MSFSFVFCFCKAAAGNNLHDYKIKQLLSQHLNQVTATKMQDSYRGKETVSMTLKSS